MLYVYHQAVVNVQLISLIILLVTMSQGVAVCINNWKSIFSPCDCQTCSNIPNAQCVQVLDKFRQCQIKFINQ